MKISKKIIIGFLALLVSAPHLLLADAGEGALFGGLTGATIGGLAGGGRGAGIGALVGVGAGAAIGAASDRRRNRYYNDDYYYSNDYPSSYTTETVYTSDNSAQIAQLKETRRTLRNRLRAAKNGRAQNKLQNNINKVNNQIANLQ
jgi:hypothetical protein